MGDVDATAVPTRPPTPSWAKVGFALTGVLWAAIAGLCVWAGISTIGDPATEFSEGGWGGFVWAVVILTPLGVLATVLIWTVVGVVNALLRRTRASRATGDDQAPSRTR